MCIRDSCNTMRLLTDSPLLDDAHQQYRYLPDPKAHKTPGPQVVWDHTARTQFQQACLKMFNEKSIEQAAPARGREDLHQKWLKAACTLFYQRVRDRDGQGSLEIQRLDTFSELWDVVHPYFNKSKFAITRCHICCMPSAVKDVADGK